MVEAAARRLGEQDGVGVTNVSPEFGRLESAYPLTLATEYAWLLRQAFVIRGEGTQYSRELQARPDSAALNDHVARRVLPAACLGAETRGRSDVVGRQEAISFEDRVSTLLEEFDAMRTPTLRTVAPTYGEVDATQGMENITGNAMLFSLSGHPAVSVPAGRHAGTPVGVQVVAAHLDDRRAIEAADRIGRSVSRVDPPTGPALVTTLSAS